MDLAAAPRAQTDGVLAVLHALVAQLLAMLRGPAARREIERRLISYETQLVLALFGGGLASDPAFIAAPREMQRRCRRRYARDLAFVRATRLALEKIRTLTGHGYRKFSRTIVALRFERRISLRRTRRLGRVRLAFVASTREKLAGAPP